MLLYDRADWALKRAAIQGFFDKHGLKVDNEETHRVGRKKDRQWDLIGPKGIGLKMREKQAWEQWMPAEEKIKRAYYNPPETTRAKLRGEFIRAAAGHSPVDVDWERLKAQGKDAYIASPFTTKHKGVQALIDSLR
jgi:proteasome accessory factor A